MRISKSVIKFLASFLVVLLISLLFIQRQKREYQVERLKLRLQTPQIKIITQKKNSEVLVQKISENNEVMIEESLDVLYQKLVILFHHFLKVTPKIEEINQAISLADKVIEQDSENYQAIKAKVVFLLAKEAFFQEELDHYELENLLDKMAYFDKTRDLRSQKETYLISKMEDEIFQLEESIAFLESDFNEINNQILTLDSEKLESLSLISQRDIIEESIQQKLNELNTLEQTLDGDILSKEDYLNEDLIRLPLDRGLSKGEFDYVVESAEMLIEEYPNLLLAKIYLITALQLSGEIEDAADLIKKYINDYEKHQILKKNIERFSKAMAKEYWKDYNLN